MKPPVWLLDLDGVINAVADRAPEQVWPQAGWREVEAESNGGVSWPLVAAQPVLDFIARTHESGRAEIRWHSTWQRYANNASRVLGLPEFAIQEAPEFDLETTPRWWKLPAALRVLEQEGRRLLWTDDDARTELNRGELRRLKAIGDVLVISPVAEAGLSRRHLLRIERFLTQSEY